MTLNSLSSMIRENGRGKIDSKIFLLQRPKGSNRFDLPWFPPCGKYWVTFTKANHCHDFAAANVSSALPYTSFTFTTWSHFFSFSPANKVHRVRRNNMSVQKVFKVVFFPQWCLMWPRSSGENLKDHGKDAHNFVLVVLASSDNTSCHSCPGFALFQISTRPPEPTRLTIKRSHSSKQLHQAPGRGWNKALLQNTKRHSWVYVQFCKRHK